MLSEPFMLRLCMSTDARLNDFLFCGSNRDVRRSHCPRKGRLVVLLDSVANLAEVLDRAGSQDYYEDDQDQEFDFYGHHRSAFRIPRALFACSSYICPACLKVNAPSFLKSSVMIFGSPKRMCTSQSKTAHSSKASVMCSNASSASVKPDSLRTRSNSSAQIVNASARSLIIRFR